MRNANIHYTHHTAMSLRKKKSETAEELESACRVIDPSDFLRGSAWEDYIRELCERHGKPGGLEYTVIRGDEAVRDGDARPPLPTPVPDRGRHTAPSARTGTGMRAFVITLQGRGRRRACASHKGEEFILVQKGSIKIFLGNEEIILKEGDSVYYRSSIPHRIENRSFHKSIILAVICGA